MRALSCLTLLVCVIPCVMKLEQEGHDGPMSGLFVLVVHRTEYLILVTHLSSSAEPDGVFPSQGNRADVVRIGL